jgi:hypothetical protein
MSLNRKVTVPVGIVRRDLAIKPKPSVAFHDAASVYDTITAGDSLTRPRERQTNELSTR